MITQSINSTFFVRRCHLDYTRPLNQMGFVTCAYTHCKFEGVFDIGAVIQGGLL